MSIISGMGSSLSTLLNTSATQRPTREQMFSKVDSDGGGTVDKVELSAFAKALQQETGIEMNAEEALTTYDADGDGGLSQEEMDTMMQASMPPPPPMGGMQAMGMAPPDKEEMFSSIDTDGNGEVSESELTTFAEKLAEDTGFELNLDEAIATYDTDGDNALSEEEMDTMMQAEMPAPPPPVSEEALAAYGQNTGEDDLISTLLSMLSGSADSDEESAYTAVNIKS
ncbi:MAG: EF-hand domain-containing protein [Desulfobulbaceae bacterium]|nr:EF-hand domain-containing protein [Desulfobulbaceae bacterium]